jgi:exodeoxyribonuclease VII small subunit
MKEIEDLRFEEAYAELEDVVQKLESGDLTLDQSMTLFERGTALAAHCNAQLDTAELRVQQLVPSADEYPPVEGHTLTPFEEYPPSEDG